MSQLLSSSPIIDLLALGNALNSRCWLGIRLEMATFFGCKYQHRMLVAHLREPKKDTQASTGYL